MLKQLRKYLTTIIILSLVCYLFPATAFASMDEDADDIKYSVDSDDTLDFNDDNFNDKCDDVTGEKLDYIKFTSLPDDDEGILYYDYDESEDDDDNTEVRESKKYKYRGSPYISEITFVPDEDYDGRLTIKYKGYDEDGNSYTGKVKISVDKAKSSTVITYTLDDTDDTVKFDEDDFFDICDDVKDEDLDYVKFYLPDDDDGMLYYNYDEDDGSHTKVSSSKKYYFKSKSKLIKRITFVPDKDCSKTVTIKYKGYDVDGDSYSGKIKIKLDDDDDDDDDDNTSNGIITYKIDDVINFDDDDFDDVCDKINDRDLDYIKITIPSAKKGILYYNYSDGSYSSIVASAKKYYCKSSPYIKNITFVPNNNFTGSCKISYKGYDVKGDSYSGTILIAVGSHNQTTKDITYTSSKNTPTTFKDADFNTICKSLMDNQLSYVKFTLPNTSNGTLYYGYTSRGEYTSKIKSSTKYYYGASPYLLNVSFVPADNYTGTVTIPYTGYDTDGLSYSGKVLITVLSSGSNNSGGSTTTPIDISKLVSSKYFSDVDISYSWAVPYIDSLYESGIISGTTTTRGSKLYSPASFVTRGDFMLILYKTLKFQTSSTTSNFRDVPSGSYYYNAIMAAKALGIVQGDLDNKFYPNNPITREDAMVMALRAVNITGKTIASGDTSNLYVYADSSSISDYSKTAVAALIKAGIITGSDDNKIYPQGNLSRAQVAAIIYRVKNL